MNTETQWLSKAEAAKYIGCHPHTLDRYIKAGRVRASRITPRGSSPVRVSKASIDKMIENGAKRTKKG